MIRLILTMATEMAPSCIIVDEMDNLVTSNDGNDDSSIQIAKELQQYMEGKLSANDGVFIIGTTNEVDKIKEQAKALYKRFGDNVYKLSRPKRNERCKLIRSMSDEFDCQLSEEEIKVLSVLTHNRTVREISQLLKHSQRHLIHLMRKTQYWSKLTNTTLSGEKIEAYFPSAKYNKAPIRKFEDISHQVKIPKLTLFVIVFYLLEYQGHIIVERQSAK